MKPVNETLGEYSDLFMLIAALVYLVAFFLFMWDMATASKTIRRVENELYDDHVRELEEVGERKAQKTANAEVSAPALVGAGGGSSTAVWDDTGREDTDVSGPADRLDQRQTSGHTADMFGDHRVGARLVSDDMDYSGHTRRPWANVAVAITVFAAVIHTAAVISRGVAANRVPWSNLYEFMTTGALVISLVYLGFLIRKDLRFVGTFVTAVIVLMLTAATIGFATPVANEQPALQSWWLVIHVSVAVMATGIFSLTFAMSVLQLIKQRAEVKAKAGQQPWSFLRLVPSSFALENWTYRLNAVAFVMWTFTLIAGAIWAEQAWGRYWGWDAKEVWTFVIWVVYAGYLHARATRGWTGTRAAWLNIIGFTCLVFNYTIVNLYFPSLHSYAGV